MSERPTPMSGSYDPHDCQFLLTPLEPHYTSIQEKERLIQSGRRHYSEMISFEQVPSSQYRELFFQLTALHKERLAQEILAVAEHVMKTRPAPYTIASLARAGTPFGALLQRALTQHYGVKSSHYSISIIRDRGIDTRALEYILYDLNRPADGLFFVDAWTAKGVITRELKRAIAQWNATHNQRSVISDELLVISDIGGSADYAATYDDYAIPSGVLNATVSGLLSRSILNESILEGQFHGTVYYEHLREHDLSRWFLDEVSDLFSQVSPALPPKESRAERAALTHKWITRWMEDYQITDINYIKPGIAEATRVLLRRVPERLLIRDPELPDVQHMLVLAQEKGIPVEIERSMPFRAAALIKAVSTSERTSAERGGAS